MPTIKNFPNNADEYIGAENVMKWLHGRASGVFGAEDNLAVTADDGLSVSVSDGIGWIANDEADGTVFWNDYEQENSTKLSLPIELPDAIYPRIDRVIVSWETINYVAKPSIEILKGTAASSPVPPSLTNTNLKRQISLAQIYVPEAASKISSDNITDERLNEDVCGLVTAGISVDTSVMQDQFLALLSKIESELTNLNAGTETMLKTEYDPDLNVKESGGIEAYFTDAVYSDPAETTPEIILSTTEEVLRKVYPVGAVYMSVNSADPADLFGFGTWERVKDRFLLAAGDAYAAGSTGGEENVSLTSAQNGPHYHSIATVVEGSYVHIGQWGWKVTAEQILNEAGYDSYGMVTEMNGEGMPHNNMPPYLAVYIWKRTA